MHKKDEIPDCGIVMPISAIDGYSEAHWADILDIITDAIDQAGFKGELVSNADDIGVIHKRIIQNLYENPVVVCDVSAKNPNVMFELGLRLAFDKPTIIVKDDETSYSFDTSGIEHLEYPRSMRFNKIVDFKEKLSDKIRATYEKSQNDQNYTTFLKHFGEFKVAKIDSKEVSSGEFMLEELKGIKQAILRLERSQSTLGRDLIFTNSDYYSNKNRLLRFKYDRYAKNKIYDKIFKYVDGDKKYLVIDATTNEELLRFFNDAKIMEIESKTDSETDTKKS